MACLCFKISWLRGSLSWLAGEGGRGARCSVLEWLLLRTSRAFDCSAWAISLCGALSMAAARNSSAGAPGSVSRCGSCWAP
jgi:hypothetical protein